MSRGWLLCASTVKEVAILPLPPLPQGGEEVTDSGLWESDAWTELSATEFEAIVKSWKEKEYDCNAICDPPIGFYWCGKKDGSHAFGNQADAKIVFNYEFGKPEDRRLWKFYVR